MVAVNREIALIGAPSSIGIRPYDESGLVREVRRAPAVLREVGIARRLNASDLGDVAPPPYTDFVRPPGGARNESGIERYSRALAARVAAAVAGGKFVVLLGGECSIVLGALLGARDGCGGEVGLAYLDGHSDFAMPSESVTGSVASMCLALAVGRGDSPLARLPENGPLARGRDVALLGRRDESEAWYGGAALSEREVLDVTAADVSRVGGRAAAQAALERVVRPHLAGFWVHLDADVLDPATMPAVDSPDPGGLAPDMVVELLRPLVRHPRALGLEVTIYDPQLDADGACAALLVDLLERALVGTPT